MQVRQIRKRAQQLMSHPYPRVTRMEFTALNYIGNFKGIAYQAEEIPDNEVTYQCKLTEIFVSLMTMPKSYSHVRMSGYTAMRIMFNNAIISMFTEMEDKQEGKYLLTPPIFDNKIFQNDETTNVTLNLQMRERQTRYDGGVFNIDKEGNLRVKMF